MTNTIKTLIIAAAALPLAACATPYTGPVEVTRFVAQDTTSLMRGSITVDDGAIGDTVVGTSLYRTAVRAELARIAYQSVPTPVQRKLAVVRVNRYRVDSAGRRSPVSVGVGGGTGTFGSGVGLGVGINLGGGAKPREVTEMSVRITDVGGASLWEGRAELEASTDSEFADTAANAQALARALFADFPGNNGETIRVDAQ